MRSKRLHDGPCCNSLSSASKIIRKHEQRSWEVSSNSFVIHLIQQQFTKLNYFGISCEFSQQTYNHKVRGEIDDHVSNSGFQHLWMGKRSTICKKVLILTKWSNLEAVQSKFRSTSRYCCSHMQTSEHFCCYQTSKRGLGPQDTWWLGWFIYMFWKACSCIGYTNSKKKNQKGWFSLKDTLLTTKWWEAHFTSTNKCGECSLSFLLGGRPTLLHPSDFWWRKEILTILQGGTKQLVINGVRLPYDPQPSLLWSRVTTPLTPAFRKMYRGCNPTYNWIRDPPCFRTQKSRLQIPISRQFAPQTTRWEGKTMKDLS